MVANLVGFKQVSKRRYQMKRNVFYFKDINSVGGVESWFYYLSKLYKNMEVYYREGNAEQIKRLAQNIAVHKYKEGEIIECDNFFCCYNPDIIGNIKAKMYAHIIHCDYKEVGFKPIMNDKFNKYIAVSKLAGDSFKELTGKDYELIYNPVVIDIPKVEKYNDDKIHLISATRLTKEKGLNRMQKLAKLLEKNHIKYEWLVYTNRKRAPIGNNVIYKDQKLDILEDIAKADYLVQLSNCEAFCYSIVESLCVGTPVIATNLPVLHELGIENGKNAIICDFSMERIDLDLIKRKCLKIAYKPPKSEWNRYLDNNTSYNPKDKIKVKVLKKYYDIELGHLNRNEEKIMSKARASYLECKGLVEVI